MYHRLGRAILDAEAIEPDFDMVVQRHRLLDTIQRSADEGRKEMV